jgi:ribonuclease HII
VCQIRGEGLYSRLMAKYLIGIDEVGRGPLAGPVTLCACMVPQDFDFSHLEGIKDSKKLSEKKRDEWFKKIDGLRASDGLLFAISSVSANEIDTIGISPCIKKAIREILSELKVNPSDVEVRLDGSLSAPTEFTFQTTIIKGDEKEPVISAASIIAKVTRDKMMNEYAIKYPLYGFDGHKGYGTAKHMKAIREHGLSPIHRKTFIHL